MRKNLILETELACISKKRSVSKMGFTLVELIVVITILAILGTIAIMAFSGYSKNARDSARISDIGNMKKSLELWILQSGTYPNPTLPIDITYSGATVWSQGVFGDSVHQTVGKLDKKPKDPLYDLEYTYSVTNSKKEYQIGAVLEKDMASNVMLAQTYAATEGEAYVTGNYNGVVTSTQTGGIYYMLAVPSIILSDISNTTLLGIIQFVLSNKSNLPSSYTNTSLTMTGSEVDFIPTVVWSGTGYTNINDQGTFQTLVENLQAAYSNPLFATLPEYMSIVSGETISTVAMSAVKGIIETNTNQQLTNVSTTQILTPITSWRSQDPNCDIEDISIGTQVWAGCNSTLGTGFEWGQTDANIGTNSYSGSVGSCYNYSGIFNGGDCTKGSINMLSTTKANTWFPGTNGNGDSEFAAIWGKLYTWSGAMNGACGIGYHLPSDTEWETLETTLNGSNCRNASDGWQCDGLGWKTNNTYTPDRRLAETLKIPLAGIRTTDGISFGNRGHNTFLWSSSPLTASAYYRHLYWNFSTVYRSDYNKSYGFSVRCLKD